MSAAIRALMPLTDIAVVGLILALPEYGVGVSESGPLAVDPDE